MNQLILVLLVLAAILYLAGGASRYSSSRLQVMIQPSGGAARWAFWALASRS